MWGTCYGLVRGGRPRSEEGILLARIERVVTMDPVTSPLIHKDSGRQVPRRSGRGESPRYLKVEPGSSFREASRQSYCDV